jgi:uncharacterized membrane protein
MIIGFLLLIVGIFLFIMIVVLPIAMWWLNITAQAGPRVRRGSRQERAERRSTEIEARDARVRAQGFTGEQ